MLDILRRCLHDNNCEAWSRLWLLFEDVAGGPVRRLLLKLGFGEHDAEDVIMDMAASIFTSDQRLGWFRGGTLQQLASWFVKKTPECLAARRLNLRLLL